MEKELNMDWLATFLFCLLLGVFGAHRFYTGKTNTAIIMLLISVLLGWIFGLGFYITSIWALVDGILLICGKYANSRGEIIPIMIDKKNKSDL